MKIPLGGTTGNPVLMNAIADELARIGEWPVAPGSAILLHPDDVLVVEAQPEVLSLRRHRPDWTGRLFFGLHVRPDPGQPRGFFTIERAV